MSDLISDDDLVERFTGQPVTRESAAHYRGRLGHRLLINRCMACGRFHQPPRPICPNCWSNEVAATEVAGRGTIHLAIFLHQGPPAAGVDYSTPYPVVTIELDEQPGLRFTGTIVGSPNDEVVIGRRVTLDWIERGGVPVPAFRVAGDAAALAAATGGQP